MNSNLQEYIEVPDTEFPVQIIECRSREEWLTERRKRIQASDAAAILGYGYKDQSPATIWESKVSDRDLDPTTQPKYLRIGKLIEPALRAIFAEETGLECLPVGEFTIYCHPLIDWLGCTLDTKVIHDEYGLCPVELKNVAYYQRDSWEDGKSPLKFQIQMQEQIAVTGASHGILMGLIGGNDPVIRIIERDEVFIDSMLKELETFWGYVLRNELPPIDGSEATAGVIKRLYSQATDDSKMLPHTAADWAVTRETCSALIKEFGEVKLLAENNLRAAIGTSMFGDLPQRADYEGAALRVGNLINSTVKRIGTRTAPTAYSCKPQGASRVLRAYCPR